VNATANKPPLYKFSPGVINANCPAAKGSGSTSASLSVTFGVTSIPGRRAYLYMSKNAFFSDSINLQLDSNGFLSSSDSSSTQQFTAIFNELAATAGQLGFAGGEFVDARKGSGQGQEGMGARQRCFNAISDRLKYGPYNVNFSRWQSNENDGEFPPGVSLNFDLETGPTLSWEWQQTKAFQKGFIENVDQQTKELPKHDGIMAFFPRPAMATIYCNVNMGDGKLHRVYLSAPLMVNLYGWGRFVYPQRNFLTGPQDTLTFNGGFLVGHKYSDQSSAKTIVDAITQPIRSLNPSVGISQNVQVQSTPGKPAQTTTTTTTTLGVPKSQ
jgi:hypothetical protein